MEDRIESIVDASEIYSYRLNVRQRHGRRHVDKEILFDQDKREAILSYKGKQSAFSIPEKVQDSLSSLYFFRTFENLSVGESVFMDVHASKKNWLLEVEILAREEITVPLGTFHTIKTKAKVRFDGVLMDKGDVVIWVTDDERKIPVKIKGKISIGPFTASLTSIELPEMVSVQDK